MDPVLVCFHFPFDVRSTFSVRPTDLRYQRALYDGTKAVMLDVSSSQSASSHLRYVLPLRSLSSLAPVVFEILGKVGGYG